MIVVSSEKEFISRKKKKNQQAAHWDEWQLFRLRVLVYGAAMKTLHSRSAIEMDSEQANSFQGRQSSSWSTTWVQDGGARPITTNLMIPQDDVEWTKEHF